MFEESGVKSQGGSGSDGVRGYKKLKVYEEGHKLVKLVYRIIEKFPRSEQFGLTSQMKRAAVSVVANVVEGYVRGSREFKQFLIMANGSLAELEYYIDLSLDLGYINREEHGELVDQKVKTGLLLGGLIKSMIKKLDSRHLTLDS